MGQLLIEELRSTKLIIEEALQSPAIRALHDAPLLDKYRDRELSIDHEDAIYKYFDDNETNSTVEIVEHTVKLFEELTGIEFWNGGALCALVINAVVEGRKLGRKIEKGEIEEE